MRKIALAILSLAALKGQSFEVASIRPAAPDTLNFTWSGGPGTKDPGLLTCENHDLTSLVTIAFAIPDYRIIRPAWMRSARFNITAKIPEGATKEQFRLMLQNLLVERFKMEFHHEQKEVQAYDLVVAKNGLKLKEAAAAPPGDPAEYKPTPGPPKKDKEGFPIIPADDPRPMMSAIEGPRWVQRFNGRTMADLARYLGPSVGGHPVDDATGLKGKYDFTLKWINDRGRPSPDDIGPTIFEALQSQLGLKLESKKSIVDFVVIDHMEKTPTEN